MSGVSRQDVSHVLLERRSEDGIEHQIAEPAEALAGGALSDEINPTEDVVKHSAL